MPNKRYGADNGHVKVERMLLLLSMLHRGESINGICETLNVSSRTVRRYFKAFEDAGIPIDFSEYHKNRHFLVVCTCPVCGQNVNKKELENLEK